VPLTGLISDEGPPNMDGMLLHAQHDAEPVEAFISRRVMDVWVEPQSLLACEKASVAHNTMHLGRRISLRSCGSLL
jgi:hypothetical protein